MRKTAFAIAACLTCFTISAAEISDDPSVLLAQILADKGTISVADLARVQTADEHVRVSVLAGILQEKGVLNSTDLARLSVPSNGRAASSPSQQPQLAKKVEPTDVNVVARKGLPVSLYGTLLFTAGYNTANLNYVDVPMIASKQGSDATGSDKNFYESARQTRLGLNLEPIATLGGKLSGRFEFDMLGGGAPFVNGVNMNYFRMRLGYGRMDWNHVAIEAGQDWSIFAPLNPTSLNEIAIPEFTAAGNAWIRLPQLRLEVKTKRPGASNFLWQLAASDPNMGDYSTAAISVTRQPGIGERGRMPSLESRLAWTANHADRDYTLGVSAHYGRGKNAGTVGVLPVQSPVDSWGVAIDYSLPLSKFFNLTGEAYEGRALGIYSVASAEAIGAVGTVGAHGVLSRGGWIQAQMNLNKQWQFNLAYGVDQPKASQMPVGNRDRNQQYVANLINKLTQNISLSLEYRRILTDYRNQIFANERGDHVDLGVAYVF